MDIRREFPVTPSAVGRALESRDEAAINEMLIMLGVANDGTLGIAEDEGMPMEIDDATRAAVLRRMAVPLRRELDSGSMTLGRHTFDEDADICSNLAALGPDALRELQDVLTWPQARRDEFLRSLVGRRHLEPLAQLIALADTDTSARLAAASGDPRPSRLACPARVLRTRTGKLRPKWTTPKALTSNP